MATRMDELNAKQVKELKEQGRINPDEPLQGDYVAWGSPAHAALLGLVPCEKTAEHPYDYELADETVYGPAATERFLTRVLEAKIRQLNTKPATPQTKDRFAPGYAPEMWQPEPEQ